jgi:hypothetical protein
LIIHGFLFLVFAPSDLNGRKNAIAIILPAVCEYSERKDLIFLSEISVRWRAAELDFVISLPEMILLEM